MSPFLLSRILIRHEREERNDGRTGKIRYLIYVSDVVKSKNEGLRKLVLQFCRQEVGIKCEHVKDDER